VKQNTSFLGHRISPADLGSHLAGVLNQHTGVVCTHTLVHLACGPGLRISTSVSAALSATFLTNLLSS
jgi:hypothetical protein